MRSAAGLTCALALAAGLWSAGAAPVKAADAAPLPVGIPAPGSEDPIQFVPLGIGKSFVVDLPRDAKDVLVADPRIANAVVRSTRRAYLIGVAVGQTNVFFFDANGNQIAGFDIAVTRDLNGIRAGLRKLLPNASVTVDGVGPDGIILSGTVANPGEALQAVELATRLVGQADKVVNSIVTKGRDQVMLRVTVAEVQRDVIKQFGLNINASLGYGNTVIGFKSTPPFSATGAPLSDSSTTGGWSNGLNPFTGGANSVSATLQAMERAGVIRTLAEPNLTAISGEQANFLVGGEFPVPGGLSCDQTTRNCQTQVQFKKFGVGLTFTPVVLAEGRISLRVMTEVSELSNENSITIAQQVTATQAQTVTIPSIRVRRAETTVEIPSGGALAMAGMIQEQTKQQINGLPGLQQVPVLGALFRSRDYINRQSELMVIVTPYIVKAVAQRELSRPDDGFADTSDPQSIFMGKLNRVYGPAKKSERRTYHGAFGFILD